MARKMKPKRYGSGISSHDAEVLLSFLRPKNQEFFESEEGQQENRSWKQQREGSPLVGTAPEDDPDWNDDDDDDDDWDVPAWDDPFWDGRLDDYNSYDG